MLQRTLQSQDSVKHITKLSLKNKKNLSKTYRLLSSTTSTQLPISKWETDLSLSYDLSFWTQICKNRLKMTKYTNLQLMQIKNFTEQTLLNTTCIKWVLVGTCWISPWSPLGFTPVGPRGLLQWGHGAPIIASPMVLWVKGWTHTCPVSYNAFNSPNTLFRK